MPGELYLVATPIGNLDDITIRAVKILESVDCVLAEDTRKTGNLLSLVNISTRLRPYHDFNKEKVTASIISELLGGKNFALVSDAGMPGIADPAFYLVREAVKNDIQPVPIPGPTSLISALVASSLPTDKFIFENFLPQKSSRRRRVLESFLDEKRTVVCFESPYRLLKTLRDMNEILPEAATVVCRELTKIHEEFIRGKPGEILCHFDKKKPKGEIVIIFNVLYKKGVSEKYYSGS